MSFSGRNWAWPGPEPDAAFALSASLGLAPALARLLIERGLSDPAAALAFLEPSLERLHPPGLMKGMEAACRRIFRALEKGEKILVYGDYDADGIAATVLLVEALRRLGADPAYYLPTRFGEGYGLHCEPLRRCRDEGVTLVVTADCGTGALKEAAYASSIGLDLIISDHHQALALPEEAVAVLNPHRKDCSYPFQELSGSGVAFKLAGALLEAGGFPFPEDLLDLAALGTVADVVPLLGENRVIVSAGLECLRRLERTGFRALAEAVRLGEERINSGTLAYILAPAVNAAGRMGEARPAAELLLSTDHTHAAELAGRLHQANRRRRLTEQQILEEAEAAAREHFDPKEPSVITLAGEGWHRGVIGIVASRLVERFHRPAVLIALEGDEGRGSARSIPGFDITAALAASAELLERFGGHTQAAGFSLPARAVEPLRRALSAYAGEHLDPRLLKPTLHLDVSLTAGEIDAELAAQVERLAPFGPGNPRPLFVSRDWKLQSWRLVGADRSHLKLSVKGKERTFDPIIFGGAPHAGKLERGRRLDLAFSLKNGFFQEQKTLEITVKDLRYADCCQSENLAVIDRRGEEERDAALLGICRTAPEKTLVFSATAARARRLQKMFSPREEPRFFSGGAELNERPSSPLEAIIIFDLPMHEDSLRPLRGAFEPGEPLTVHLLYSDNDRRRNRLLQDLSLPTEAQLVRIVEFLGREEWSGAVPCFPGPAAACFDQEPLPAFWERARAVLTETGLLREGRFNPPPGDGLAALLPGSPTFRDSLKLRAACDRCETFFLEEDCETIAIRLRELAAPSGFAGR